MTQGIKGTGPTAEFNPDGTKKTSKQMREVYKHVRKKYPRNKKKSAVNGGTENGILHGKTRYVAVLQTHRHLFLITIAGVGAFLGKRARIEV